MTWSAAWQRLVDAHKLDERPADGMTVEEFAKATGMSTPHARRLLREEIEAGRMRAVTCRSDTTSRQRITVFVPTEE